MAAVFAFHTGKAVMQIAAIEIAIDHLLDIRPPEAVLPGEILIIDLKLLPEGDSAEVRFFFAPGNRFRKKKRLFFQKENLLEVELHHIFPY